MPASFREPDRRDGDEFTYFDYAKAVEAQKKPLPWRQALVASAGAGLGTFGSTLLSTGSLSFAGALGAIATFMPLAGLPLLRAARALSASNLVTGRRPPDR